MHTHHSLEEKKEIIRLHELGASMSELMKRYHVRDPVWSPLDGEAIVSGQTVRLYHGKSFTIGNTIFTYIEKDM